MNSNISVTSLRSGEKIALCTIQILRIPHISIIDKDISSESLLDKRKLEIIGLLNGIYQVFKDSCEKKQGISDISYEFLWITEPVENQPYKASIQLLCIVRAIDWNAERATWLVENCVSQIVALLKMQKYDLVFAPYSEISAKIKRLRDDRVRAIVKEERIITFQNPAFSYCYSYDRLSLKQNDFSGLIDIMCNYPHVAVSFQLIPTFFTAEETTLIDSYSQALERSYINQISQPLSMTAVAENSDTNYKYYSNRKHTPLFLYNILVFGSTESTDSVASKVYSDLSSGTQSTIGLNIIELNRNILRKDSNFYPLPWAVNEAILQTRRNKQIWNSRVFSYAHYRLPYIITAEEASEFFRLPFGTNHISAGIAINEAEKKSKTFDTHIIDSGDITVGQLKSSFGVNTIGISLNDLTRHMFVTGTPGSGKTTFSVGLLDQLWNKYGIPFLVIEPAKNEYRALVGTIPDLQVFTPGKNFISPFLFNPFIPPKNVRLESYKSTLKTAFSAAVSMGSPLTEIFDDTIRNCYSKFGWLDSFTLEDGGHIFNISDFVQCFEETFQRIGYTGDAKNIGRAGVVRLNGLVNLFDNYSSIPIEDLLTRPTVIELAALENDEQKSLIIALVLLSILAYVNANYIGDGTLKNVILLEEAHVLLGARSKQIQNEANPSEIAQNLVKRMLAEIRSYGVGIVIADQSPRKVTSDVIGLTDVKLVFRLVEGTDRQIIADSSGMTELQAQRLSKLRPGEAFFFFNRLEEPEEIRVPNYRKENSIKITISDDEIKKKSQYWKNREALLRPYPQCVHCSDCKLSCDFNRRLLGREIAQRIFSKHFSPGMNDFDTVKEVFGQISKITSMELNGQPLTHEILSCVKVHLWRKIRYGTKIPIRDIQIENSLKK